MPVDPGALLDSLHTLLAAVDLPDGRGEQSLAGRLDRLMASATQVLQVDGVGLMLLDERGVLRVAGASDAVSAALEHGQQELGEGPGVDCVRSDRTVAVDDLPSASEYQAVWRWLRERATGSGRTEARIIHSVLSVPVRVHGLVVGTLNAFQLSPMRWTTDHVRAVEAYAGIVGVLIRLGRRERHHVIDALRYGDE